PGGVGWLCLNACAYDRRNGTYYYIPYTPPGGAYTTTDSTGQLIYAYPSAVVGPATGVGNTTQSIQEFGIWAISDFTATPKINTETQAWAIPPKDVATPVEQ